MHGEGGGADRPIGEGGDTDRPIGETSDADRPIGVFDSGIGGLSVLNALRAEMPHERFVYFADTGHAPYGERGEDFVIGRSRAVAGELVRTHRVKALVVACNTATAAAIAALREEHPQLPLVGIEPALKPAAAASRTGHIGVIATRGTLASLKFQALHALLAPQAHFSLVACDGLAAAIERDDRAQIETLCARYLGAVGAFGDQPGQIDTLVLGCTHYPFVSEPLRRHAGPAVRFIDTGVPVAQQTRRLLAARAQLRGTASPGDVELLGSGDPALLHAAAARWLQEPAGVSPALSESRR